MTAAYSEDRREYFKRRYQANKAEIVAQQRAYQAANPEVVRRAQASYRTRHAPLLAKKRSDRYEHNKEGERAVHRVWREANKVERALYMRNWRQEKREHRRAYDEAYRIAHPHQRAENQNARRARKIGNGGSHTRLEWEALKAAYSQACGYCHAARARLTKDHDIPLVRGGSDEIANIIPACLPCNRRKHAKTGAEFVALLARERCSQNA